MALSVHFSIVTNQFIVGLGTVWRDFPQTEWGDWDGLFLSLHLVAGGIRREY
jgi:hypothetical protein